MIAFVYSGLVYKVVSTFRLMGVPLVVCEDLRGIRFSFDLANWKANAVQVTV